MDLLSDSIPFPRAFQTQEALMGPCLSGPGFHRIIHSEGPTACVSSAIPAGPMKLSIAGESKCPLTTASRPRDLLMAPRHQGKQTKGVSTKGRSAKGVAREGGDLVRFVGEGKPREWAPGVAGDTPLP